MEKPEFYFVVEDIFDIVGRGIVVLGSVQGDCIKVGDKVVIMSNYFENKNCTVSGIEAFRKKLRCAYPGDSVGLTLSNIHKTDVHLKDVLEKI